jgi:hypothetical protein
MLEALIRASLVDAAGTDQGNSNGNTTTRSLYDWSAEKWKEMQQDLLLLLATGQMDAVFGPCNEKITKSINRLQKFIRTNVAVSPLRASLRKEKLDGQESRDNFMEAWQNAIRDETNPSVKGLLSSELGFQQNGNLFECNVFPFAVKRLPFLVTRIFKKWTKAYSIQHLSRCVGVSDDKEKITEIIGNDQPPHKRLRRQNHASCDKQLVKEASQTWEVSSEQPPPHKRWKKSSPHKGLNKQSPEKNKWSNKQSPEKRLTPSPPKRSQIKKYAGRRQWSEEEKRHINLGIQRFGVGSWSAMWTEYKDIFKDKTTGQMKDCYRTMKNKGQIWVTDED